MRQNTEGKSYPAKELQKSTWDLLSSCLNINLHMGNGMRPGKKKLLLRKEQLPRSCKLNDS